MFDDRIEQMLEPYQLTEIHEYENALKEIIQEIALLGLWRSKFYEKAVFYGGSALRILYRLDRFSEDLDFSLIQPDMNFEFSRHLNAIKSELEFWGFEVATEEKNKKGKSTIESAFIKANTLIHLLKIDLSLKTHKNAVLKIKLEVDQNPATGFTSETKYHLNPIPFAVKTMALPSLFAGKMHALLCRTDRINIKGRDWYDLIWFVQKNVPCDLVYLKNKMTQTGHMNISEDLSGGRLIELLSEKITQIDFEAARNDVEPFLKDTAQKEALGLWSDDFFFNYLANEIRYSNSQISFRT